MNGEKEIRLLIGRFMQGLTSLEEEEKISQWFAVHHDVSDDLKPYRLMFAYFDKGMPLEDGLPLEEEMPRDKEMPINKERSKPLRNHVRLRPLWSLLAAAAAVALLIVLTWPSGKNNRPGSPSATLAQAKSDTTEAVAPSTATEVKPSIPRTAKPKLRPRKRGTYRKHLHSPAPPVTWLAQTVVDSIQQTPEVMADAHLKALEEQQNEMLYQLYLVSALQAEDLASYTDEDTYGQEQETR